MYSFLNSNMYRRKLTKTSDCDHDRSQRLSAILGGSIKSSEPHRFLNYTCSANNDINMFFIELTFFQKVNCKEIKIKT